MRYLKYTNLCVAIVYFVSLFAPNEAYAYLDPGTGSYILQIALATLLGVFFTFKLYWKKIKNFVKNLFKGKKKHAKEKR